MSIIDPFVTPRRSDSGPLLGMGVYTNSPDVAELAGAIGFDFIWIEIEHGPATFETVQKLCAAAQAGGAAAIARVPDAQRCHVLRAIDCGARAVVVPMVDDADTARQIVRHGKFPPIGNRGLHARTRGNRYGMFSTAEAIAHANRHTHLFAQIESTRAVENVDDISRVEGLDGIFLGPNDLALSMGKTDINCGEVVEKVVHCIRRAKSAGKRVGIACATGTLLNAAMEAGTDIVLCGSDIADLATTWYRTFHALSGASAA